MTGTSTLAFALDDVRRRIVEAAERARRDPQAVRLVVATKTVDPERVAELVTLGITDAGENRVQEAVTKRPLLPTLRWHMFGHLQTNKAGRAAAVFDVVQSVDSERVAEALDRRRPSEMGPLDVLVEAELTGVPGRTGATADLVRGVLVAITQFPNLQLQGLMTMAPFVPDPESARGTFRALRLLHDDLQEQTGLALPELSMGMSNDFEVAVEEGATMVRIGRAIFGERPGAPPPHTPQFS